MDQFVHLHVHSDNSIQDASVAVTALADRAEELGMEYLALTDHGNMFGIMEFIAACAEKTGPDGNIPRTHPVKPIIGCEVYVSPASRFTKDGAEKENKYYHLVLLAANREGYLNLVKLCSAAYTEGFYYRPRIDDELLALHHGGLIGLSACVSGEIPRLIQAGKTAEAEQKALFYRDLFGSDDGEPNFYLEIQNHGIPAEHLRGNLSQAEINKVLSGMSVRTGIPLAATNDVHYLKREDAAAHDTLLCIGTGKKRSEEKRKKYYGEEFYFKSAEEMAALFPGQEEALSNTLRIARRCKTDIPKIKVTDLPQYLPEYILPQGFDNAGGYLKQLTAEGLVKRYPIKDAFPDLQADRAQRPVPSREDIEKRAAYELDVIIKMGFTGYFLIVADFINWAKDHGIEVGPGRGSGAGSIVAYALRITDIDPIKYGLLFERFLNPERISMPDFDIDFCNERREEVLAYVTEKYGKERVAQIITFGTLKAKAVIKDVARTLGVSIPESDMLSKLIPFDSKMTLARALAEEPKLREYEADPRYTELFSLARKLEGLKRHVSIHAAGVVIGKDDLTGYVPLYRDTKTGIIATQYSMNYLEDCGLVKMDFLGLKTLDLLKHTEELVRRRGPAYKDFSLGKIPEDDGPAFTMLGEGRSFGIFQFESEGMQNILRQAKPGKIEDLIALNALYRPGPMANIPQFIESKNGRRAISYPHPALEEVLKETYGVIVYQEQVMQVARIIAGYTMGQADMLRRAMGKKKKEIIDKEKLPFLAGAEKQGYAADGERIYDMLVPFAGYGFNKSHAACYTVLAYRTAYLKANFPAEFTAANLSNEIYSADKNKLSECISEGRKSGLEIDPPDINRSDKLFTVVGGRIVFGFLGIKGIGSAPADEIIQRRQEKPYKSFLDFLDRITLQTSEANVHIVSRKVIELLIKTGAFDGFGINRATLLANMEAAVNHAQKKKDEAKFGQAGLFEDAGDTAFPDFEFTSMPELDRTEQLTIEKELIGFYFSGHPLDAYKEAWETYVHLDTSSLDNAAPGIYTLVGILKPLKITADKTGRPMAFGTLEDYRGEIDLAFFGDVWAAQKDKLRADDVVAIRGKFDLRRGRAGLQVISVLSSAELKEGKLAELDASDQNSQSPGENRYLAANRETLDKYREVWEQNTSLDLSAPSGENHTLVGILSGLRTHITKNQKEMAFGTLEDYRGRIDLVFFERCWECNRDRLIEHTCIALKGKLDLSRDRPSFLVSSLLDLGKLRRSVNVAAARGPAVPPNQIVLPNQANGNANGAGSDAAAFREVHIRLRVSAAKNEQNLFPLRDFLIEHPGPALVFIHVNGKRKETVIRTAAQLCLSVEKEELAALETNPAVAEVWVA